MLRRQQFREPVWAHPGRVPSTLMSRATLSHYAAAAVGIPEAYADRVADELRVQDQRLRPFATASLAHAIRTAFRLDLCMPRATEPPLLDGATRLKICELRAAHPKLLRHRSDDEIWTAYGAEYLRDWMPASVSYELDAEALAKALVAERAATAAAAARQAIMSADDPEEGEELAELAALDAEAAALEAEEAALRSNKKAYNAALESTALAEEAAKMEQQARAAVEVGEATPAEAQPTANDAMGAALEAALEARLRRVRAAETEAAEVAVSMAQLHDDEVQRAASALERAEAALRADERRLEQSLASLENEEQLDYAAAEAAWHARVAEASRELQRQQAAAVLPRALKPPPPRLERRELPVLPVASSPLLSFGETDDDEPLTAALRGAKRLRAEQQVR